MEKLFWLVVKKIKNFLSLDWTCIYWESQRFDIFENGRKSEARFWGVVTLHCQTMNDEVLKF